ncbi:MAG: aminopeptidase [Lachnospiraceae bacterium]|nr:aminopeptidase [Lachnospiraceae bacterium]
MIEERCELATNRIQEIKGELDVATEFKEYFCTLSSFILDILNPEYDEGYNRRIYADILPENYSKSYGNPKYCSEMFGDVDVTTAQMLCFIYSEIRALIPYVFELKYYENEYKGSGKKEIVESYKEILVIYLELFIELYVMFKDAKDLGEELLNGRVAPKAKDLKDMIYWFISDNCDIISPLRIRSQLDPTLDFATNIIMTEDLGESSKDNAGAGYMPEYLYKYGEYITENEIGVAQFLGGMPQEEIDAMAKTYTEGYRIGFVKAGKPLDKKTTVNIRYNLGFERVVKSAIRNFEEMGLKPVIYRAGTLSLVKSGVNKIGFTGAIPNKQYDYDHREDLALYLNKDFVNRKTLVIKETYESMKDLAAEHAGPAVIEVFGEEPFAPVVNEAAITLDVVGRKNQVDINDRLSQLTNKYIKGEERSFTIIAYPIPEIGDKFAEIFSETVKLNNLDYKRYENMQQQIIDVLDTANEVRIEGRGTNKTRLIIKTQKITDASKQTSFENCVADVNIPVGEVFTSPVLEGTNGVLNVSEVYLFGLNYIDLTITFKNGMIVDYSCKNFEGEEENKKYIRENIMHNHETLPIGEFAIGTNTTAYAMARKYGIEAKLPILIGEKTGPHFAVGDTCYSHEEDVKVYNPDGKEIIARDNELTKKYRETDPSKAYFNCHTDITIPYDELGGIYAVHEDGSETAIIEDGEFVLEGLEELNDGKQS